MSKVTRAYVAAETLKALPDPEASGLAFLATTEVCGMVVLGRPAGRSSPGTVVPGWQTVGVKVRTF